MEITDFTGIFDLEGRFTPFTGYDELCDILVSFGEKSRREGLLSLEDDIGELESSFMKLILQFVVDGTDPELVREMGERKTATTLHYLEEILSCIEFSLLNRNAQDYERLFGNYIKSRDTGLYNDLVLNITGQVSGITFVPDPSVIQGRYSDIMETALSDLPEDYKFMVIENHIDSVLHINSVYNKIILSGILGVQAGFNPRILREMLFAYTSIPLEKE